jgi:hypothetical protein
MQSLLFSSSSRLGEHAAIADINQISEIAQLGHAPLSARSAPLEVVRKGIVIAAGSMLIVDCALRSDTTVSI